MSVTSLSQPLPLNDSYIRDAVEMLGRQATAEEIAAHFDALRAKEVAAAVAQTEERGRAEYKRGWNAANSQNELWGWVLGTGAVVAAFWGAIWLLSFDSRAHAAQMASCESGQTIACMDAVADQQRNVSVQSFKPYRDGEGVMHYPDPDWYRDRVQLLRAAYKLKTGQDLPAIGDAPPAAALSGEGGRDG